MPLGYRGGAEPGSESFQRPTPCPGGSSKATAVICAHSRGYSLIVSETYKKKCNLQGNLEIQVLKISKVDCLGLFFFIEVCCGRNPCLSIPDVSYGFGTNTVLRSKQNTVADFLAKQIWS